MALLGHPPRPSTAQIRGEIREPILRCQKQNPNRFAGGPCRKWRHLDRNGDSPVKELEVENFKAAEGFDIF
jgi:hypothetical protein